MASPAASRVGLALLAACALSVGGCGSPPSSDGTSTRSPSASPPSPTGSSTHAPSTGPSTPSQPAGDCATQTLAAMSRKERVGQLFMVGFDSAGPPDAARRAIEQQHVGAVTMTGRSHAGTAAVRRTIDGLQAASALPLLVATDQEGGQVQVLQGPGFPDMPSAEDQGRLPVDDLEAAATEWGEALAKAGVNVDLAPVLDVVPASIGEHNQPIGRYDRQYGSTAKTVTSHGIAVVHGLQAAGVIPTVKHFPGLGSVTGNPDVTAEVVDTSTSSTSTSLDPFRAAVAAGVPMVMVSSATYARIDPEHIAMFSSDVLTDLLRHDLGFTGVAVTDDVGNAAAARAAAPISARAVRFLLAGGDLVLTLRPQDVPAMAKAVLARAASSTDFAARVDQSAERVLRLKDAAGLLPCSVR